MINYILENSNNIVLKTLDLSFHYSLDFDLLCKILCTQTSLTTLRYLHVYFYSRQIELSDFAINNVILKLYILTY